VTQVRKPSRPTPPPATPRLAAASTGPLDSLLNPELFKALCDPTRASIAVCLCKCSRPCSVSEIAQCCNVDLSVVSRHLAMLARAGVLDSTKDGRIVFYRVRYTPLINAFRALANAIEVCSLACDDPPCCGTTPGDCRRTPAASAAKTAPARPAANTKPTTKPNARRTAYAP